MPLILTICGYLELEYMKMDLLKWPYIFFVSMLTVKKVFSPALMMGFEILYEIHEHARLISMLVFLVPLFRMIKVHEANFCCCLFIVPRFLMVSSKHSKDFSEVAICPIFFCSCLHENRQIIVRNNNIA